MKAARTYLILGRYAAAFAFYRKVAILFLALLFGGFYWRLWRIRDLQKGVLSGFMWSDGK